MRESHYTHLAVLLAAGLSMLHFGWVGFIGSDDALYVEGARSWLHSFPYLGDTHWALRHTFVIPVALAFRMFGESEASLTLVSLFYYLGNLTVGYLLLARRFHGRQALAACVVLMTVPVMVIWSTVPDRIPRRPFSSCVRSICLMAH
jgi:4-amino-4-deoxy-L-arabinose transferase-like glycosyltransferase